MPRIEGTFPPPIHGVSTVKPRNRGIGYGDAQLNFRSDPTDKLTRRPSSEWIGKLRDVDSPIAIHTYNRGEDSYRIIVEPEGAPGIPNVTVYKNAVKLDSTTEILFPISAANIPHVKFMTIKDRTYLLNAQALPDFTQIQYEGPPGTFFTDYEVEDEPTAGTVTERVSHYNVTVAGEYGEHIGFIVKDKAGNILIQDSYDIEEYDPENEDFQGRSTTTIAYQIATIINLTGAPLGVYATSKGSSVAVWSGPVDTPGGIVPAGRSVYDWLKLEIETGQGDRSVVSINQRIEKVDGLPLYAVAGTRITVRPNPRSDDGTYYLEATPIEGEYVPGSHLRTMQEVIWVEHRSPYEPYRLEPTLMPYTVDVTTETTPVKIKRGVWKDRRTGDNDSCPPPTFLDSKSRLTAMSYFQKRLVLLSDDEVHMTETDDLENWWKASAIQLLVTDPIGIASSAPNIDVLEQAVQHNRDLLVLAKNGQFKIDGKQGVSPQTVSMPLTTAYECEVEPPPVSIGNSAFIPMSFGNSAGLHEYTGQENTSQDMAFNIARHVKGYLHGNIQLMTSSSSLEMIVLTTDATPDNVLFVYDQMTEASGKRVQQAWSRWEMPEGDDIVDINMNNDILELAVLRDGELHYKILRMNQGLVNIVSTSSVSNSGLGDIHLDDHVVVTTPDGVTLTLPPNFPWDDNMVVVRGAGTNYERTLVKYTKSGDTLTLEEDVGLGNLEIGLTYTSSYTATRPFHRDSDGQVVTTDRIRIAKYRLSIIESYEVWMHIISDYYDGEDQGFNSRVMNANNNLIGYEPHSSDEVLFGFSQDAKYALAEFYTDGFLALTIDGITWEGQYYQSSRRM